MTSTSNTTSGKNDIGNPPDSPVGIEEALLIDDGNPGLLLNVIARACYQGNTTLTQGQDLSALLAGNDKCPSDVQREVQRYHALTRLSTARQVQGYLNVINAMKIAGGIKHLVILSAGPATSTDIGRVLQPIASAAADAGIEVSVMTPEPDIGAMDPARREQPSTAPGTVFVDAGMAQRRREDDKVFLGGAETVAEMTGGEFYRIIGDAKPFFFEKVQDLEFRGVPSRRGTGPNSHDVLAARRARHVPAADGRRRRHGRRRQPRVDRRS